MTTTTIGGDHWAVVAIVLLGIVFHAVYMMSIFDVYFRSPLVHGMRQHSAAALQNSNDQTITINKFAKRIVFIVSDGLRADSLFELSSKYNDSFIHDLIRSDRASWGVSHTRVPTESRPCHVAMFAGFYEDVSAVTTGWKENPVHFDSVFNQSNYVLQIGSPDVVKIFRGDHIDSLYYEPEMEDFASANPAMLDKWVFDKLEHVLTSDTQIQNKLRPSDKAVIFLHLLGVDTSGHAYRPSGQGYTDNIIFVDQGVRNITRIIDNFFGDDQTTYIFTADHGMSSKGSHGDGNPECTRTPFVAWGAGIRTAKDGGFSIIDDLQSSSNQEMKLVENKWHLNPRNRKDIRQADVAPLMTALLGLPYPVNNVGTLPLYYLDGSDEFRTRNLFANAMQIYEQFKVKEQDKRVKTRIMFKEYSSSRKQESLVTNIQKMIAERKYNEAQSACMDLISFSIKGLSYYQTYDWPELMTIIAIGYLSWIAFLLTQTLKHYSEYSSCDLNVDLKPTHFKSLAINVSTLVAFIVLNAYLVMQSSPLLYHAYLIFPIIFSNYVLRDLPCMIGYLRSQIAERGGTFTTGFVYVLALEAMVIGYFKRGVFSSCFIVLGIAPTLWGITVNPRFGWLVICIFTSLFTLLPADYGSDTNLVCIGGFVLMIMQIIWRRYYVHSQQKTTKGRYLFGFQLGLICLSTLIVYNTESSLTEKKGLPLQNQIASWVISGVSLIIPLFSPPFYKMRMQSIAMALACPFILSSVNYEVLFYAALDVLMVIWIKREVNAREASPSTKTHQPTVVEHRYPSAHDDRSRFINYIDFSTALLFIFFINVSFFGTGNLATIASFELTSVYRFITVFSPFLMTAILILKVMTPLLLSTLAFSIILRVTKTPQAAVFCIVVALFDIMTINFFFLVQDTGSWLEIGNSISRFAIGNIMILLLSILFGFSQIYTRLVNRWVNSNNNYSKGKPKLQ